MEDLEYLQQKPSQLVLASKRSKYGIDTRCSATLRKDFVTESRRIRNAAIVLKHVSVTEGWKPNEIENNLLFDDGGLTRHACYFEEKRDKHSRSVVAQHPKNLGTKDRKPSYVTYSMNKKKRWLLPETLKEEIYAQKVLEENELCADIDVTVVERAVGLSRNNFRPDVVDAASTAIPEKENFPKRKKHRTKRKTYSWSTDLLGLSRQSKTNLEERKPEVTYEFCRSRLTGPYVGLSSGFHSESSKKSQRRKRKKINADELQLDLESETEKEIACDDDGSVDSSARQPLSILSWINHAQDGKVVQHRVKTKKPRTETAIVCGQRTFPSKKGRAVFKERKQEPRIQEKNKENLLETIAADVHFENVLKAEAEASTIINISLQSFFDLSMTLCEETNGNEDPVTMYGTSVWKSQSVPLKFAFQMENQLSVKLPDREVKSALSFLVVEPLSDPRKCSIKEFCFTKNGFCQCHTYLPTKLKLVIQSAEDRHQECMKVWKEKLDAIITRDRPGCPGMYLEKVVKITSFTFNKTAEEVFDGELLEKPASKKKLSLFSDAPYKRKVLDKAHSLLGFSAAAFNPEKIHPSAEEPNEERQIIVNDNPRDFCEICWTELTEENEGYRATALQQCKHWFCHDCWRKHLTIATRGAATHSLKCPGYDCTVDIDNVTLMAFMPGNLIWEYHNRKFKNKVKRSENFHHCPQCSQIVQVTNKLNPGALQHAVPLSCSCGMRWCSHCKGEPHWPASCLAVEDYHQEIKNRRNPNIIKDVSGRKCPMCHERIEKDGGCRMVTCLCGHCFCWKCMKSFDDCMYTCKGGSQELETWNVTTDDTRYAQVVLDAEKSRKNFEATKTHRRRLATCAERAKKEIAVQQKSGASFTFDDKLHVTLVLKDKLHQSLLHCNALHNVVQYLTIDVALKKQTRNSMYPKLNRFLMRLKLFISNIEISLFEQNPKSRIPLEQVIEKKVSASVTLLRCLALYINRAKRSKMRNLKQLLEN